MKILFHIISYEWKNLWRSNKLKVLLLVIFGSGLYGIYFGKYEIEKQEAIISEVKKHEQQQFDSLLVWSKLDTTILENKKKYQKAVSPAGVGWKKHFTYYLSHQTPAAAGLCLGQRDLFPVYYAVNVSDLARQLNTGELANPMKLLTGNFDLSYVFIFLIPLLIISLFYNIYSEEKEGGTLSLLKSQSTSLTAILLSKGLLRIVIVLGTVILLLILGFLIQGISLIEKIQLFGIWLLWITLYSLFWAILTTLVVWLKKSSELTAIISLGIWLLFTLITPTLLNLQVSANNSLPNRAEASRIVYDLYDKIWESPKSFVWTKYNADHPNHDKNDTTNFKKWQYASFTLLDKKADELSSVYEEKINQRNEKLEKWKWIAPAALIHEKLSRISDTDRQSHLKFKQYIYANHRKLKNLYYSKIFKEEDFSNKDIKFLQQFLKTD